VERARELASASEARVVNAVLRKVPATLEAELKSTEMTAAALSRRWSHPEWLVERWIGHFGADSTRQLLEWNQNPALVYARSIESPGVEASPLPEGFVPTEHPGFFRVERPDWDAVETLLAAGRIYLQDPATSIAPELLAVSSGETILDVCAAPGGKTLQLAERVGAHGRVVALDLPETRLRRLEENLTRHAGLPVAIFGHDATKVQSTDLEAAGLPGTYDGVLVDAACSNTGVLRHRVDAKWRLRPVDLKKLPRLQHNILRNVARLVRPGGRLVYSTCSLEPEENQGVVDAFLERGDGSFVLEDSKVSHPWESGCDGAGAFLLRRVGGSDS
jgi:16S rRNA (cytosine967-C5)-methyltransferase